MPQDLCTLTDYEQLAIELSFDLANGHAYQDLSPALGDVMQDLQLVWHAGRTTSPAVLEHELRMSFAKLIGSDGLLDYVDVMVSPTASNSIDIVGAYMAHLDIETILLEPTFDNLALLFRRRHAAIRPMPEQVLAQALLRGTLNAEFERYPSAGAIFLVNPNNPTGQTINAVQFRLLCETCERRGLILILDNSFRMFNRMPFDDYAILRDTGVQFIAFEDTGKCWPTQDLKLSMMVASAGPSELLKEIYRELYLGPSLFSLALFRQLFDRTQRAGIATVLWDLVDARRNQLRQVLQDGDLAPLVSDQWSPLPVEWLRVRRTRWSDLDVCRHLGDRGLGVLPGRHFFWSSERDAPVDSFVRISLLKPSADFDGGLRVLARAFGAPEAKSAVAGR